MSQQIVLEAPQKENKSLLDLQTEVADSNKTVQALSLLEPQEQIAVSETTAFIVVSHKGECYTVPPHAQVPAQATVVRTEAGVLEGIAAVTGG